MQHDRNIRRLPFVVRFLKANPGQGILLSADWDLQLYAWYD